MYRAAAIAAGSAAFCSCLRTIHDIPRSITIAAIAMSASIPNATMIKI
jgi:hypothetical protein